MTTFINQCCRLTLVSLVCFLPMIPSYAIAAPLPISLIRTTVNNDKATGKIHLIGNQGSVQGAATVSVLNRTTRKTTSIVANSDGSFFLILNGKELDILHITVKDKTGSSPITGLTVMADPATIGPYPVGTLALDDPNGFPLFTNPTSSSNYGAPLAWARIMYPAVSGGSANSEGLYPNAPVASSGPFPIVVFLHGRHAYCDTNGIGAGGESYMVPNSPNCLVDADRIPNHEGFNYLMKKLASFGIFSISISQHQLMGESSKPITQGQLVLNFLDTLRKWNQVQIENGLTNGTVPFSDLGGNALNRLMFKNKLDLSKIGLCGHSVGGAGVGAAQVANLVRAVVNPGTEHNILAICSMAPVWDAGNEIYYNIRKGAFLLLHGSRDQDRPPTDGFAMYDPAYPDPQDSANPAYPKMAALLYAANHNYFNTIWTDQQDAEIWPVSVYPLGNPWANAKDESTISPKMTAAEQRLIALSTIVPFFRWQLQGISAYREVLTGTYQFASVTNSNIVRTFQHAVPDSITPDRKIVDNFRQGWTLEDLGYLVRDPNINESGYPRSNTLNELVTIDGYTFFSECPLGLQFAGSSLCFSSLNPFSHATFGLDSTFGLKFGWAWPQTYTSNLPAGRYDVSMYAHLTFRVAETILVGSTPPTAPRISLIVGLEDGDGKRGEVRADRYGRVPIPYSRGLYMESTMGSIRIPLTHFQLNNSGVNLTRISKIYIRTEGAGNIGLADIEFSN